MSFGIWSRAGENNEPKPTGAGSRHILLTSLGMIAFLGSVTSASVTAETGRLAPTPTADSVWNEPHPLRREALLEGRDYTFNKVAFIHRYSYRNLYSAPAAGEDGFRGTTGSVTSDMLFTDIHFHYTLGDDSQRQRVSVGLQRSEDFDGHFDRQLLGISHQATDRWRIGLLGNMTADKANTDIYLEARWRGDANTMLRFAIIFPDLLYNDKVRNDSEYLDSPQTFFAHWRYGGSGPWLIESAVNYTPETGFIDNDAGVEVDSRQLRTLLNIGRSHQLAGTDWVSSVQWRFERTRRSFQLDRADAPDQDRFERDYHMLELQSQRTDLAWQPTFGVRYLRLDEAGYTGIARDFSGTEDRTEIGAFAGGRMQISDRVQFTPSLHVARMSLTQAITWGTGRNRDDREWQAEMTMPWSFQLDPEADRWLTLNITAQFHEGNLGGGNMQLHWPL